RQVEAARQGAGLLLGAPAQREAQEVKLVARRGKQEIALIAGDIPGQVQLGPTRTHDPLHIMPGGERGGAEITCGGQEIAKRDALIAANARHRRFAAPIRFGEVLDDLGAEPAFIIENVMSDAETLGDPPRVSDVASGAAGAFAPDRSAMVVELQRETDDLKAA